MFLFKWLAKLFYGSEEYEAAEKRLKYRRPAKRRRRR